jgi:hypothetical protein
MDFETARAAAERYISDIQRQSGIDLAITRTLDFDVGWVFFYNSAKYLQTRSFRDALAGNAPIIVSKVDGSIHMTGTSEPIEHYIEKFRREHSRSPSD